MFTQLESQESGYLMVRMFLDKDNWIIFNGMNTYFVCWFFSYFLEYVLHFNDVCTVASLSFLHLKTLVHCPPLYQIWDHHLSLAIYKEWWNTL